MSAGSSDAGEIVEREIVIVNRKGLHARASARFVQLVANYDCEVEVSKDGITVGGRSIMGLMMLAASAGSSIRVSARGPDAQALVEAIAALVADRFGEES